MLSHLVHRPGKVNRQQEAQQILQQVAHVYKKDRNPSTLFCFSSHPARKFQTKHFMKFSQKLRTVLTEGCKHRAKCASHCFFSQQQTIKGFFTAVLAAEEGKSANAEVFLHHYCERAEGDATNSGLIDNSLQKSRYRRFIFPAYVASLLTLVTAELHRHCDSGSQHNSRMSDQWSTVQSHLLI